MKCSELPRRDSTGSQPDDDSAALMTAPESISATGRRVRACDRLKTPLSPARRFQRAGKAEHLLNWDELISDDARNPDEAF